MNAITMFLFDEIPKTGSFTKREVADRLRAMECDIEEIGPCLRFTYVDGQSLAAVLSTDSLGRTTMVSLSVVLPDDAGGWATWSKENEMKRLELQKVWMKERGFEESSCGLTRISNCFSPQDGASSITIYRIHEKK